MRSLQIYGGRGYAPPACSHRMSTTQVRFIFIFLRSLIAFERSNSTQPKSRHLRHAKMRPHNQQPSPHRSQRTRETSCVQSHRPPNLPAVAMRNLCGLLGARRLRPHDYWMSARQRLQHHVRWPQLPVLLSRLCQLWWDLRCSSSSIKF